MYYENLLKNQHSLLYAKEREVVSLREQLKQKELETDVSVQFQMSEQAHNLLLGKKQLDLRFVDKPLNKQALSGVVMYQTD